MSFDVELLEITKDNIAEAQFMAANFINKKLQNRIFFDAIAAESVINYLGNLGRDISDLANIHSIKRIVEKIDISDIILDNIHIDVRVAFDKSGVFIPKSHFELSIVPDIYAVLKYDNNFEKINLIGFFEPSKVQLHNTNDEYYFVDADMFKSPFDMLDYINNYNGATEKSISQEEILKGRELSIKVADHDISDAEFKDFMQLLVKSKILRASVLEYDNFETLASNVAIALRINKKEQDTVQNSVVDFDDFIDMDESSEEDHNSDKKDDDNEKHEDYNGDDMLEDNVTNEQTSNLENTENNKEIDNIADAVKIAGATAAAGLEVAAGAQNIVQSAATGEAIELAALAGEAIANKDLNNDDNNTDINNDISDNNINHDNLIEDDINLNITDNLEEQDFPNLNEDINEDIDINFEDNRSEIEQTENQDLESDLYDIDINEETQISAEPEPEKDNDEFDDNLEFEMDINEDKDTTFKDFEENMELQASEDFIDFNEEEQNDTLQDSELIETNANKGIEEDSINESNQIIDKADTETDDDIQIDFDSDFDDIFDESISDKFEEENNNTAETLVTEQESKREDDNVTDEKVSKSDSEDLLPDDSTQEKFISDEETKKEDDEIPEDFTINLDQEDNLLINFDELENNDNINNINNLTETEQNDNFISLNEIEKSEEPEESEESNKNQIFENEDLKTLDPINIDMEDSTFVLPDYQTEAKPFENTLDFDQIPTEAAEIPAEDNNDYELIDLSELSESQNESISNVEVNFTNNDADYTSIDDFDLNSPEITPVNTVKENSTIISDKNQTPGEIIIDINKNDSELDFSVENQHLEELYNNENVLNENSALNNDVRVINEKGKSVPVVALAGGLTVFIILAGLIIFSIAKFMSPQQNANNDIAGNMDIQNNMGGNVPEMNINNNSNIAMNNSNQDFERRRNKLQQESAVQQNKDNLKQIPDTAFMSVRKLSWEVPDYISLDNNFKQYFQSAGKSLKAGLSSDLLLATDYAYSDQIRLSITFDQSGGLKNTKILLSSGSSQVDNIVLQSVNQTLKVLKAPSSLGNDESTTVILKIYL
ncbi:hypothetical protein J6I39_09280 [bacterium]|nr:hypothetical protein [bacterium]